MAILPDKNNVLFPKGRRISAHYIFPGSIPFLKYGILEADIKGFISGLTDTDGKLKESANLEFYNGIVLPGFVLADIDNDIYNIAGNRQSDGMVREVISGLLYKELSSGPVIGLTDCRKVLADLLSLQKLFPEQGLGTLLTLFTSLPAEKLGISNVYGSFQTGNKPGILLLSGTDLHALRIHKSSKIMPLLIA